MSASFWKTILARVRTPAASQRFLAQHGRWHWEELTSPTMSRNQKLFLRVGRHTRSILSRQPISRSAAMLDSRLCTGTTVVRRVSRLPRRWPERPSCRHNQLPSRGSTKPRHATNSSKIRDVKSPSRRVTSFGPLVNQTIHQSCLRFAKLRDIVGSNDRNRKRAQTNRECRQKMARVPMRRRSSDCERCSRREMTGHSK